MIGWLVPIAYIMTGMAIMWFMIPRYWQIAREKDRRYRESRRPFDGYSDGPPMDPPDGVWMRCLGTVLFWPLVILSALAWYFGHVLNKAIDYRDPLREDNKRKALEERNAQLEKELDM